VATGRPADARLLAVAPAGRSAASYTTIRDMTVAGHDGESKSGQRCGHLADGPTFPSTHAGPDTIFAPAARAKHIFE
jgi:hypothetical protein